MKTSVIPGAKLARVRFDARSRLKRQLDAIRPHLANITRMARIVATDCQDRLASRAGPSWLTVVTDDARS